MDAPEEPTVIHHRHDHYVHGPTAPEIGVPSGNGHAAAPPPDVPVYPGRFGGGYRYYSLDVDGPSAGLFGWLALALAIAGGVMLLIYAANHINWHGGSSAKKPVAVAATSSAKKPVAVAATMKRVLASEHFTIDKHSLCQVRWVDDSQKLRLMLNRGDGCQKAIRVVLPAEQVPTFSSKSIHRSNATFVYTKKVIPPDDVANIKSMPLGQQLKLNLRYVYVRLTPHMNRDVQLTQSTDVIIHLKGGATVSAVINR